MEMEDEMSLLKWAFQKSSSFGSSGPQEQEKLGKLWGKLVAILTSKSACNWIILRGPSINYVVSMGEREGG